MFPRICVSLLKSMSFFTAVICWPIFLTVICAKQPAPDIAIGVAGGLALGASALYVLTEVFLLLDGRMLGRSPVNRESAATTRHEARDEETAAWLDKAGAPPLPPTSLAAPYRTAKLVDRVKIQ